MRHQSGFGLLEVLVAFAILSLSLAALLQVFATELRNTALSGEYSRAALYAESLLATFGTTMPLVEGVEQGQIDEKYYWRSTVAPYVAEDMETGGLPIEPFRIVIEVFWKEPAGRTRSVALETLRLAPVSQ